MSAWRACDVQNSQWSRCLLGSPDSQATTACGMSGFHWLRDARWEVGSGMCVCVRGRAGAPYESLLLIWNQE